MRKKGSPMGDNAGRSKRIRTDDEDSTDLEVESEVEGESSVDMFHRMLKKKNARR